MVPEIRERGKNKTNLYYPMVWFGSPDVRDLTAAFMIIGFI